MDRHLQVRRENGHQERDDPPGCDDRGTWNEQEEAKCDFGDAAEVDEFKMEREVGWHHPKVEVGLEEVVDPSSHEEHREHDP